VPGGVLRPECTSVVGNGVVIDPLAFLKEVASLRAAGVKVDGNLFVSNRAQVILPYHRMMELGSENAPGRAKIGTTSLRHRSQRMKTKWGAAVCALLDLLDRVLLRTHIENACREKNMIAHALFNSDPLDPDKMFREYADAAEQLAPFVRDTALLLNRALAEESRLSSKARRAPCWISITGPIVRDLFECDFQVARQREPECRPHRIDTVIGITESLLHSRRQWPVSDRTAGS